MNPAMVIVWITGPILAYLLWVHGSGWMIAKFGLVLLLTLYHHVLARWMKAFAEDRNTHPARTFRIANEVPTLLMIGIDILVVVKPF